ncbi:ROOT GROWTH DEFECTIVE 3 isoform X2 [Wolffia australiana]
MEEEMAASGFSDYAKDIASACSSFHPNVVAGLSFRSFDINKVLDFGSLLVASGGQEYDVAADNSKTPSEKLARQKKNLRHRLGLDVCEQFMDMGDMIKDEDLLVQKNHPQSNGLSSVYRSSSTGQSIQQLVANMVPGFRPRKLSAREMNLLKRKAKMNAKDQVKDRSEDDDAEVSPLYKPLTPKSEYAAGSGADKGLLDISTEEIIPEFDGTGGWPFHLFVEQLIHDMFDPIWEVRHGAIMALRETLTHQGASVGVYMPDLESDISWIPDMGIESLKKEKVGVDECDEPPSKRSKLEDQPSEKVLDGDRVNAEMRIKIEPESEKNAIVLAPGNVIDTEDDNLSPKAEFLANLPQSSKLVKLIKLARYSWIKNWEFLQDCAIRFICVLALDRFGDYVSDQVVAPVRETCAQGLGAILKHMHPTLVYETLQVLLQMQCRQEWEIRHGSLLGIKYLVAVRQDMLQDLLGYVLPACKIGLEDPDDDVRAVAAEALIPAASSLVSLKKGILHPVITLLWDILLYLDDLNPSTSSVMNLLAELYSQSDLMLDIGESSGMKEFDLNKVSLVDENLEAMKPEDNPYVLSTLAPRLWPFMRHTITSVRHSAIRTLERLLEVGLRRSTSDNTSVWPSEILGDTLRIVYQNLLLEINDEILHTSERVWTLLLQCSDENLESPSKLYFSGWVQLAATATGSALDDGKMYWPVALPRKSHFRAAAKMRAVSYENENVANPCFDASGENKVLQYSDEHQASSMKIIFGADSEKGVMSTRVVTATALGGLVSRLREESLQAVVDTLWNYSISMSGVQRQVACLILIAWFKQLKSENCPDVTKISAGIANSLRVWLLELLSCPDPSFPTKSSSLPYSELSRTYVKMRNEGRKLFNLAESCVTFKDLVSSSTISLDTLSIDDAMNFVSKFSLPRHRANENGSEERQLDDVELSRQRLLSTACYLNCVQSNLHLSVSALIAAAIVWMSELPSKLNPVILPMMASIKREQEEILQQTAAEALAELIYSCVGRKPGPNDKLIKNICNQACMDFTETPQAAVINSLEVVESQDLLNLGRPAFNRKSTKGQVPTGGEDKTKMEGIICRRGSELAFKYLCGKFGSSLFEGLPKLWDCITEFLKPMPDSSDDDCNVMEAIDDLKGKDPQLLINNIQVIRSITPSVNESLRPKLVSLLPSIIRCISHPHVAVRLAAAKCITSMARTMTSPVMGVVIKKVIPLLGHSSCLDSRQGAGILMSLLVQEMGVELVAYAPLLIVPLLKCMSDSDRMVRSTVTHSFAALVPLLPLAKGLPLPQGLCGDLSRDTEDAKFLEQLLDNSQIDDYVLPIKLKVALRRYQQEGINWLSFLRRFKLHGILCDDMGLGKTLQASAIVAADIIEGQASNTGKEHRSLIIVPSTLVGHWAYEIDKYVDEDVFKTLQYVGSVQERALLRDSFPSYNLIIASYDVVRKDINFLEKLHWNYCILDEGHVIKNAKSKITNAVKQLKAENRLVLSGTPIQNNVLELWSLFDFLMPGFLGTERQFQATYGKPLLAARDTKCSSKDAEAGALAMEALHKQVMPFLLRRTKEEVLLDLPEKIIQDRYCDLSPVQLKLYEQFSSSDAKKEISTINMEEAAPSSKATSHIFQALQYLLKLCSHPLLVLGQKPPESLLRAVCDVMPSCSDVISSLHALEHSPKLVALKEILDECGIGQSGSGIDGGSAAGEHRVLIFAQHRSLLDIIEKDLFQAHMKSVTYLRLDGSVEPEKRFDIVKIFNSDPTIDVLLLTTHVGGLGLNLTSADTLVFMEHDWNPMKDHQAMDRAHRLGQRKVVNVHRLIMRGTLEEKVMSLQSFKVSVANAVINADNASLSTMNTDHLLDLFAPPAASPAGPSHKAEAAVGTGGEEEAMAGEPKAGRKGLKAVLSGLGELWDASQYDDFNLNSFLAKLNS